MRKAFLEVTAAAQTTFTPPFAVIAADVVTVNGTPVTFTINGSGQIVLDSGVSLVTDLVTVRQASDRDDAPASVIAVFASATRTASANSSDLVKPAGYRGVDLLINVSAVGGSGQGTFKVQAKDPQTGVYIDIPGAVTPTLTGTGMSRLTIYPGVTETANVDVSQALPTDWRVVYTKGTGTSVTASVTAEYL